MSRFDAENNTFRLGRGLQFRDIHSVEVCEGQPCVIHNPATRWVANVEDWDYNVRESGLVERVCECGVGHPDIDSLYYMEYVLDLSGYEVHGCCGCCGGFFDEAVA